MLRVPPAASSSGRMPRLFTPIGFNRITYRFVAAWIFTLAYTTLACLVACVIGPERMWSTMVGFWARVTLRLLGIKIRIQHPERLQKPAVFIVNHQSLIDVILVPAVICSRVKFVAKRELRYVPFWGWAFMMGGAIAVDRSKKGAAFEALARGIDRLASSWAIVFFPEGTRSPGLTLGQLRGGAFRAAMATGRQVIPIGISATSRVDPPHSVLLYPGVVHLHVGAPMSVPRMASLRACTSELVAPVMRLGRRRLQASIAQAVARVQRECREPTSRLSAHLAQATSRNRLRKTRGKWRVEKTSANQDAQEISRLLSEPQISF